MNLPLWLPESKSIAHLPFWPGIHTIQGIRSSGSGSSAAKLSILYIGEFVLKIGAQPVCQK